MSLTKEITMRGLIFSVASLVCVLSAQLSSGGEKLAKPDASPSLQGLLDKAKRNNLEIRLAEAKVKEAEILLTKTRLLVQNKVAAVHAEIQAAQAVLKEAQATLIRAQALRQNGVMSAEEYGTYVLAELAKEGLLNAKKAEMPYLLAEEPGSGWEKFSLEELTQKAARDNPDVRLSEAGLGLAKTQLAKTRVQELNKVASLVADIAVFTANLAQAKARFDRANALFKQKTMSAEEYSTYEQAHQKARQELRAAQVRLPQLLGEVAQDPDAKK
jgi:multidrug resistance efflux pump